MRTQIKRLVTALIITLTSVNILDAQFERFAGQYDIIMTIAGRGFIDEKGVNGWENSYEAGLAIDAELSRPHFVMADSNGVIYIADKDAHAVRKIIDNRIFTAAGTSIPGFDGDGMATEHQLDSPNGLWIQSDGTFYILDLGNSRIRKVTQDGKMTTIINDPEGIETGRGLWVSSDEQTVFYSSGTKIKKWTPAHGLINYASGFSQLGNLIMDPSGHIVVTDRGANMVFRVYDDGSRKFIAGNGGDSGGGSGFLAIDTGLYGVRGVWFMPDLSFVVATHEGSQVWYVDHSGIINLFLNGKEGDEYHSGDGQHFQSGGYKISEVRSISVDFQGNILIAENDRGFIRKIFRKTGTDVNWNVKESIDEKNSAFPNPFNSNIKIQYNIAHKSFILVEIYDILGHRISTLIKEIQESGSHMLQWDATDNHGIQINSGLYFYKIKSDYFEHSRKILYVK